MYSAFVIHDNDEDAGEREMATCFFVLLWVVWRVFFLYWLKRSLHDQNIKKEATILSCCCSEITPIYIYVIITFKAEMIGRLWIPTTHISLSRLQIVVILAYVCVCLCVCVCVCVWQKERREEGWGGILCGLFNGCPLNEHTLQIQICFICMNAYWPSLQNIIHGLNITSQWNMRARPPQKNKQTKTKPKHEHNSLMTLVSSCPRDNTLQHLSRLETLWFQHFR